jgi:peroxidase
MVWANAKMRLALSLVTVFFGISLANLEVGFYSNTCPQAESIVKRVVSGAALSDPNLPAILLRLHFHDCFVEGCDGSILVNNGAISEKNAFGHEGVRGFEIVEAVKAELEAACPGVVSCSDIVALAARDAISLVKNKIEKEKNLSIFIYLLLRCEQFMIQANGPAYEVPTGRRDGRVSNMSLAKDMPEVSDSIEILKAKFMQKGLNAKDLVLLSGMYLFFFFVFFLIHVCLVVSNLSKFLVRSSSYMIFNSRIHDTFRMFRPFPLFFVC